MPGSDAALSVPGASDVSPRLPKPRRGPALPTGAPTGPTVHPPGSEGKLRVLAARAARRLPLFDARDAPGLGGSRKPSAERVE